MHCRKYKYFILINSSVRGPFLTAYAKDALHWTRPFTDKLTPSVKLVGSTINCGGSHEHPPEPHVQSYVVATDAVGLQVLLDTGKVFKCYDKMKDVVYHGEMGSSRAILDAGYNIDSLMLRYQGVDWREHRRHVAEFPCNGGLNPLQPQLYDGVDIDPLEVMFVKVKEGLLGASWGSAMRAARMDAWKKLPQHPESKLVVRLSQNYWLDEKADQDISKAEHLSHKCFDWEFYLGANAQDLGHLREEDNPALEAWIQFMEMGIFEGRPHRWHIDC